MASKDSNIDTVTEKTRQLSIKSTHQSTTASSASACQTADYYDHRSTGPKITFARLEKGLLLFIYLYETSKNIMKSELALWDHQLCLFIIKENQCSKPAHECRREHETRYRQKNLCNFWYINDQCNFGQKCRNAHQFSDVDQYHQYIRTSTDYDVYCLIRFVRNFAGHFVDSVIKDEQSLYKDLIVTMTYLVHYLSPKRINSVDHLNLFLEKVTIDQLSAADVLLKKLSEPFDVPEIFFRLHFDFNDEWYPCENRKRSINFNDLSSDFVGYFNRSFLQYYNGRLKSRGAKTAWP